MHALGELRLWSTLRHRLGSLLETQPGSYTSKREDVTHPSVAIGQLDSRKVSIEISQESFRHFLIFVIGTLLSLAALSYVFVDLTGHDTVLGIMPLLDVGKEQSIATFFSIFNILAASVLSFFIYRAEKLKESPLNLYWLLLSMLLFYMALDESATIHEKLIHPHEYFFGDSLPMIPSHGWMLMGAMLASLVGLAFLPFLFALPRRTAVLFVTAGSIFLLGALGLEFVSAWMVSTGLADYTYLVNRLPVLLEEGCEMSGVAILNCALLRELVEKKIVLTLRGA